MIKILFGGILGFVGCYMYVVTSGLKRVRSGEITVESLNLPKRNSQILQIWADNGFLAACKEAFGFNAFYGEED